MYPQNPQPHVGGSKRPFVVSLVLGVLCLALATFGTWAFINYQHYKNDVDAIVSKAVDVAKQEQKVADEADFVEKEKLPTTKLSGPSDLGSVSLSYPKTWSAYVDKAGSGGVYTAYLNPGHVRSVSQKAINAVVVNVENDEYEDVLKSYDNLVSSGDLKATPVTLGEQVGTRLDGAFSKDIKGAEVLFKLRDKTLRVSVQSNDYLGDFNNIILPSLTFNP